MRTQSEMGLNLNPITSKWLNMEKKQPLLRGLKHGRVFH